MSAPPPTPSEDTTVVTLAEPGGVRRLLGGGRRGGACAITLTPAEIRVEHPALQAPIAFAPGAVSAAAVDHGPADAGKGRAGRFPILHRLAPDRVVPQEEGIEGWLWTADGGSVAMALGDDAPNLALVLSPPLGGDRVTRALPPAELAELAKRSPHGDAVLPGLLLRVADAGGARHALDRYGLLRDITDRHVAPPARRHLPGDKPANPELGAGLLDRSKHSMPPPGAA